MKRFSALLLVCVVSSGALAQMSEERGTFVLHKFAKAIGKETYALTTADGRQTLTSDFLFTDRGSPVPLKTIYVATTAGQPVSLTQEGRSSRMSPMRDEFKLDTTAQQLSMVRNGKSETIAASPGAFLIDGYSPVAMQQMLLRYWLAHGKPAEIPTPPTGSVHIQPAGDITVQGKKVHGYVVSGLIWGVESLWMDDSQNLVALVSTDAEFDHFEAVRDDYESALATFIATAAKDDLEALRKITASARQKPAKRLVIANVTLIDGTGAPALEHASVFIENGVIAKIVRQDKIDTKNTEIIDGSGKFLIPGLWDMHAHYEQVEWGPIYLAAGVTTVRDVGNEIDFITTVKETLNSGKGIGPHMLMAGIVDGLGPTSLGAITADTPEEALAVVRRYKAAGAEQIKIYSSMKPALVPVITAEAHKLGMTVTGHVPDGMTTVQAVEAGYDQINHIQYPASSFGHFQRGKPLPPVDFSSDDAKHQIATYQQHHTVFDDTVSLYEGMQHPATMPLKSFEPGIEHVAPQLREALDSPGVPEAAAARSQAIMDWFYGTMRELHRNGLMLVVGTDQNIPGYSVHREMEIYVEKAGFTPMEALQAATSVPARVMGVEKTVGTIEAGKRADMLLLDGDPLADIHNTRKVLKTIAAGAVYDPGPLWSSVGFKP